MTRIKCNAYGLPLGDYSIEGKVYMRISDDTLLVFDDMEEKEAYLFNQEKAWEADAYCNLINELHNNLFKEYYTSKGYLSLGEILLWKDDELYGEEATELISWWIITCKEVELYLSNVSEESAVEPLKYIDSLPKLLTNND